MDEQLFFFTVFKLECSISNYKQFLFSRPLVYLPLTLLHVILCWTGLRDICLKSRLPAILVSRVSVSLCIHV